MITTFIREITKFKKGPLQRIQESFSFFVKLSFCFKNFKGFSFLYQLKIALYFFHLLSSSKLVWSSKDFLYIEFFIYFFPLKYKKAYDVHVNESAGIKYVCGKRWRG
jgi:hypothetical protein